MKKTASPLFLSVLAALSMSLAQAAETTVAPPNMPVSQTVGTEKAGATSALENLSLDFFTVVHGPSLDKLDGQSVDSQGRPATTKDDAGKTVRQGLYLDSDLSGAYMFTKDVGAGVTVPFLAFSTYGQGLVLGDVGVKAFNKKLINSNGLTVSGNFILQAPTSQYSRDRGMTAGFKTTPSVRYSIPDSRFKVGSWTEAKYYAGVDSGKSFKLFAAPYVNYQVARTLSLNVQYTMEWDHNVGKNGDAGLLNFRTYETDLQPGVVWNVTPHLLFNPFVQIFTTKTATSDSAAVGAVVSATLL